MAAKIRRHRKDFVSCPFSCGSGGRDKGLNPKPKLITTEIELLNPGELFLVLPEEKDGR